MPQNGTAATESFVKATRKSPPRAQQCRSPDRPLFGALRRCELHGFSAAACAGLVRIVENELRRQLLGLVVHLGSEQKQHRFWVDQDLDALVLDDLVSRIDGIGI